MTSRIECIQGKLYVGHEWTPLGGDSFESLDPVEQYAIWRGPTATDQQVDAAFLAARSSFRTWGRTRLEDRIEIARRFASVVQAKKESLAQLISTETGKPLWESRTEVATVIGKVEVSIDALQNRRGTLEETIDGQRAVTRFRPHGVLLVLGPFNLPAHLPGSHMVPALLAGNCVVFKPSEQTPAVGE